MNFELLILFLSLFSFSIAAPAPSRTINRRTTTVSTVTPSDVVLLQQSLPNQSTQSLFYGRVSRVTNSASDITTLFTFYFADASPSWAGYTCKLSFANPSVVSGSTRAQLFTIGSPNTAGATWNNRPFRNNHIGTLRVLTGGAQAVWEYGGTIPCPTTTAARLGFELVPAGDAVNIEWVIPQNGIRVDVIAP